MRKITAFLLILLMQGPAMWVQEVAWVNMLVTYSQERGLKRGVIETFDGDHPCKLCKSADKLRQQKSEDPAKPAAPQSLRPHLAWGPMMLPGERIHAPVPQSREIASVSVGWQAPGKGRGADGPEPPPPKCG